MIWFWLAFFALVAFLLFLDLGVLHRKAKEQSLKSAALWTVGWMILGLSFSGVVYLMYENHWLGVQLKHAPASGSPGTFSAITYVSAYLLEQALSIDNIFVISLLFQSFRVPIKYQHRVLFWGIMGAIVFRVAMLGGGVWLASRFDWIFYVFGGYLAWQGAKLLKGGEDDEDEPNKSTVVRALRKVVKIVDGDHGGKFTVLVDGKRALTTVAVCLVSIELTDIVFALDSIPAVLSVSEEPFIVITSNIFAIMGLRSLYFVLAGAMAKFKYLKIALAILLIGIGVKMCLHNHVHISHVISLAAIAGIIGTGVLASLLAGKGEIEPPHDPAAADDPKPPAD
ncbi:MAG: TerC/Alx family metal homeostasis membrane protein [Kofleriaceae bacterium]|nr:TerC/Alx family metal homeostasis membrane protein [Kofleriaceae bacterium]